LSTIALSKLAQACDLGVNRMIKQIAYFHIRLTRMGTDDAFPSSTSPPA
jgi:hypothetical protein